MRPTLLRLLPLSGVLSLLFAFAAAEALAGACRYSDGTTDDGPCLEVVNGHSRGSRATANVWCQYGPTSRSHKIVLRAGDHFTCKRPSSQGYSDAIGAAQLQRTQVPGCNRCWLHITNTCAHKTQAKIVPDVWPHDKIEWTCP